MTELAVECALDTLDDTRRLGERIGAVLRPGDVVVLTGDLGAGKTALTQSIAVGMGITDRVTSPTFVIARVHASAAPSGTGLVHVDAYRLDGRLELDDLDLDTDLDRSAVVVEWGAGLADRLVADPLTVTLVRHPDDRRTATLVGGSDRWSDLLRPATPKDPDAH